MPYVFTEQGVAMLSSILKSDIAIQVNILIIRIFTKLREIISTNKKLNQRVEKLEKEQKVVFAAINQLMDAHKEEPIIIEGFKGK